MMPAARISWFFLALAFVATGSNLAVAGGVADLEDEFVRAAATRFCSEGRQHHCDDVKAFAAGHVPAFSLGRNVFVGRSFANPGSKEGTGFVALFVEVRGGSIRLAAERLRPDNEAERREIEAFVNNERDVRKSSRLRTFLDGSWGKVELRVARKSARSLVVEGPRGASAFYRADGGRLLALRLARQPKMSGSFDSLPALSLASFPSVLAEPRKAGQRN
jgi:hypothetical protein